MCPLSFLLLRLKCLAVWLTTRDSACHPFMHACMHSFIHPLIHSSTHSLTHPPTHPPTPSTSVLPQDQVSTVLSTSHYNTLLWLSPYQQCSTSNRTQIEMHCQCLQVYWQLPAAATAVSETDTAETKCNQGSCCSSAHEASSKLEI